MQVLWANVKVKDKIICFNTYLGGYLKIIKYLGVGLAAILLLLFISTLSPVKNYLDSYAIGIAEKKFGSKRLAQSQEDKILSIAAEMGITENIVIRKMNTPALLTYGYYNAFAYFAGAFFQVFPISDQPFMFVSEGFLEDLSAEEQRFLIGHELIHIRDRHTKYLTFLWYLSVLLLLIMAYYMRRKYLLSKFPTGLLVYFSLVIPNLTVLAYRRHIEWVADTESMKMLGSYDGCMKLMSRWQKDFEMPKDHPMHKLLSDHPSCYEREQCCLELKNQNIGIK